MGQLEENNQRLFMGFGGAGCAMLEALPSDVRGTRVFVNTDDNPVTIDSHTHLRFSKRQPLDAQLLRRKQQINQMLDNSSEIFVLAGLGGYAGSELTKAMVEIANKKSIPVKGFVTLPFAFEGQRKELAQQTLAKLQEKSQFLYIHDHELEFGGNEASFQDYLDTTVQIATAIILKEAE